MKADVILADHHPDCYPGTEAKAVEFFRNAMTLNPQPSRKEDARGKLVGVITPHIDFRVSLASYAAAFAPLLDLPLAATYVVLGVGHRSPLEWNLDRRDYLTPLGRIECDLELVDRLAEGTPPARLYSSNAHRGEHSIEFALVWLQALHRLHPSVGAKEFRFVPLLCGGLHSYVEGAIEWDDMMDFHRLSRALQTLMKADSGEGRLRIIVSIDGCHLGPRFQHPFQVTPALLQATAGWEQLLWKCAEEGDARAFLDWFREEGNDRYFDGVGALALLLAAGGGAIHPQRTYYEQWFTERDASAVTFSSGRVLSQAQ